MKRNFAAPKLKNSLYFQKWNFLALYFSYISGRKFPNLKNKKTRSEKIYSISSKKAFLIFQEIFLYAFLYFLKDVFLALRIKKFQETIF